MTPPITITIKRGATFRLPCAVETDAGAQVPITGWDIQAQVRHPPEGVLVAAMTVINRNDAAGTFDLECDTHDWPLASVVSDIRYVDAGGGTTQYTADFVINVLPPRTVPAP